MPYTIRLRIACAGSLLGISAAPAAEIYMSGRDFTTGMYNISRSVAGSNTVQTVYNTSMFNSTIGVTVAGQDVYATSLSPGELWRGSSAGGSPTLIASRGVDSYTRQVEVYNGNIYWNEEGTGRIFRASPD